MSDPFLGDSTGLRYIFLNVVLADTVYLPSFAGGRSIAIPPHGTMLLPLAFL